MRLPLFHARRGEAGVTLVEIMVASSMLVIIMLGLLMMFNQTQRAFRTGLRQVDILDSGRATADLLVRDLEGLTSSGTTAWNFVRSDAVTTVNKEGTNAVRTNILQAVFVLGRENNTWTETGYIFTNIGSGAATLLRCSTNRSAPDALPDNSLYVQAYGSPDFHPVVDGVVHFLVRPLDSKGRYFTNDFDGVIFPMGTNLMPAFVELELGMLEPETLKQLRALPGLANQQAFLSSRASRIHIFRQTIPVRQGRP